MSNYFFDVLPTDLQELIYHKNLMDSIQSKDLQKYDNIWVLHPPKWRIQPCSYKSIAMAKFTFFSQHEVDCAQSESAAHVAPLHQVLIVDDVPYIDDTPWSDHYTPDSDEYSDYYSD
tara:strand:+ start:67 stop:417 length:351 start_codon:yes stop_codon:yes gene_type:complete